MPDYDLIIIGAGPGGYVAGIRAAQLGLKTLVVEKENLGGICLNWGCIPTKALLKTASLFEELQSGKDFGIRVENAEPDMKAIIQRSRNVASHMNRGIEYLFRKNGVTWIQGTARLLPDRKVQIQKENGKSETISARNILIATGARARPLPMFPYPHERVLTYREALVLDKLPSHILIVGAGAIGVEFAYFYRALGSQVTLMEAMDRIVPLEDPDISKELERAFRKKGIQIHTGIQISSADVSSEGVRIHFTDARGKEHQVEGDYVLLATGIQPNTQNLGLEEVGIPTTDRGFISVDLQTYQTPVPGYFAIGDVIPTPALAHVASHEGIVCVERIAGKDTHSIDYQKIPSCTYCKPEIASIGLTEPQAREQGYEIKVGKFPYTASGKARAEGHTEGFVKLIFDARYGELLGAHMIGGHVTELLAEVIVAMNLETTEKELFYSMHPHPTLSEAVMEAAGSALGHPIHI